MNTAAGGVAGAEAEVGAAEAVGGARADGAVEANLKRAAEPEPWWAVMDSSTA